MRLIAKSYSPLLSKAALAAARCKRFSTDTMPLCSLLRAILISSSLGQPTIRLIVHLDGQESETKMVQPEAGTSGAPEKVGKVEKPYNQKGNEAEV